ncbi:restriction endonuclease subunit S [Dorea sp. YH-dor228]|uniref:restriction endonuclease subunit S n=1 Tax=Dorea sp. YH-dor228 TaxID=3151120 RepID=UPI003242C21D
MDTKALRQKILDLAIRGKLVPQDPNDEPASALLERIREQKQQMVKEGKLKKKDIKNDSVIFVGEDNLHYEKFADGSVKCIEDEIPFELPDGWNWVRLGSIANIVTGRLDANAQTKDGAYPFFTCGEEVFKTDSYAFDCNAILLGGNNATGDFKMHKFSGKFNAYQRVYVITTFPEIDVDYLYNHIRYYLPRLQSKSIGSQTRYLKLGMITELLIALPTFCEQKTISRACDKYINYCTEIASEKNELKSIIKDTKSKILDLAIRGQLVPQNPDDEPASVLLGRIRAEKEELIKQGKSKRDKKESIIFKGDDNSYYRNKKGQLICIDKELPYELPDGWTWVMLPEIVFFQEGPGILKKDFRENGVPLIRISGLQTEKVLLTGCDYLDEEMVKNKWNHFKLDLGDVVLCTSASIGKASIVGYEAVGAIPYTGQIRFKMSEAITRDYFLYLATSSVYLDQVNKMKTGNCIQHYGPTHLKEVYVPLPPINEQEKIANKLKVIFSQFSSLESILA